MLTPYDAGVLELFAFRTSLSDPTGSPLIVSTTTQSVELDEMFLIRRNCGSNPTLITVSSDCVPV